MSVIETRVQIPLGPPHFSFILRSVRSFALRSHVVGRSFIGQQGSVDQSHGVSELLIPSVPTMRVTARHRISAELIGLAAAQSMSQQRRSHFEWDTEILQPRGEGVAEIVEVEFGVDLRMIASSSSQAGDSTSASNCSILNNCFGDD